MRALWLIALPLSAIAADEPMQTRVFPVKVELFGGHTFVRPNDPLPVGYRDPTPVFHAIGPKDLPGPPALRQSARAVLANEGITFPPGASAAFNPVSGMLSVHNTPANLEHTRLFLETLERDLPVNFSFMITVIEAPGEMIRQINRQAGGKKDCRSELDLLLDAARGLKSGVSIIGDTFIECRPGSRFSASSIREHIMPGGLTTGAGKAAKPGLEMMEEGFRVEADVTPNATEDDFLVNLQLGVSVLPPAMRSLITSDPRTAGAVLLPASDFWQATINTSVACQDGKTRLIGITRPPAASSDVLWAAFLHFGRHRIPTTSTHAVSTAESERQQEPATALKSVTFDLPRGLLEHMMPVEPPKTLQRWLDAGGLAATPGAKANFSDGRLVVTNTQENIERIHGMVREMHQSFTPAPVFTFLTIEAQAAFWRDRVRQHALRGDHQTLWKAVEAALAADEANHVSTARIAAESGSRASHESGMDCGLISEFSTNDLGQTTVEFERRNSGSVIEIDSYASPTDPVVSLNLDHAIATAPPATAQHRFKPANSEHPVEFTTQDFFTAKTHHALHLHQDSPRLVSLHRPAGHSKPDVLWATFVFCDVHRLVAPKAAPPASEDEVADPERKESRVFQLPPGFFNLVPPGWGPVSNETVREAFRTAGVDLPTSADLSFSQDSRILRINTARKHLAQVGRVLRQAADALDRNIIVTAHVMEVPADAYQAMKGRLDPRIGDDAALLAQLQTDARIGRARHVTTLRVESHRGTRSTTEQTREGRQLVAIRPANAEEMEFVMDTQKTGLTLEVEPALSPNSDRITVSWGLKSTHGAPVERHERLADASGRKLEFPVTDFQVARLLSAITLRAGTTRLAWACDSPEKSGEMLQLVFLQAEFSQ